MPARKGRGQGRADRFWSPSWKSSANAGRAIDAAWSGTPAAFEPRDVREMELSFSRGFSHGFLDGNNHKVLVLGDDARLEIADQASRHLEVHDCVRPSAEIDGGDGQRFIHRHHEVSGAVDPLAIAQGL